MEGRVVDQERLQSAYDYARKAIETTQLSESTALVKEFKSSDAYQWAQGSRTTGTSSYDSSYRQAVDHQATSEHAYGHAKELTRTAQFMREWSSGAQTDFTNYAAKRLGERGLLREDDPIKLQRAVTEIAYAYAKGGEVGGQFVPGDNPLAPSRPPAELLGWNPTALRHEFDQANSGEDVDGLRKQATTNESEIRDRQSGHGVTPGKETGNEVSAQVHTSTAQASADIAAHRQEVSQTQGSLSADYNASVNLNKISPHHAGNKAVWDSVGVQTDNRAGVGVPPERPTVGEWHFDKDGVPAIGPKNETGESSVAVPTGDSPEKTRRGHSSEK